MVMVMVVLIVMVVVVVIIMVIVVVVIVDNVIVLVIVNMKVDYNDKSLRNLAILINGFRGNLRFFSSALLVNWSTRGFGTFHTWPRIRATSAANFSEFCSASSSACFSATFIASPSVILSVGCSISLRDVPSSAPLRAGAASVSPDIREKDTKI
ncbi:hypothetical protein PPACK8108_LOCUS19745 [Phakopsora pachyrhizi]|uniref:Uncharacterized protein n=1 Tax=Phakopsora pachyrhizi TaxID=170000 RepID=A0AAV0BEA4_PHAPC|nr:hypothetical protein PPACK8108_LOCUS19745 [Phakopsora pachyrhizi]